MATDFLRRILESKRAEVEARKREVPLEALRERVQGLPVPLNLAGALMGARVRVVAEIKRASPSKGPLRPGLDPAKLAKEYLEAGAAALSVLTDGPFFQGSLADLEAVARVAAERRAPVLRKEFIIDPYQLYEARVHGADAVLLIVAALGPRRLPELLQAAQELWLQCLVEVHDEEELETALEAGAEIVGINNRDLHTFHTDLATTERLAPKVPFGKVIVSESGIHTAEDVARVRRAGAHAILVGEALVTSPDPGALLRELAS